MKRHVALKHRECANIFICRLCMVVLSIFRQLNSFFSFEFEHLRVQPCWFSLPGKTRKRLAHDVMYTAATHARHAHDLIKMEAASACVIFSIYKDSYSPCPGNYGMFKCLTIGRFSEAGLLE